MMRKYHPIIWILPGLLTILILVAYPLSIALTGSLHHWTFGEPLSEAVYVGLANYEWVFGGGDYFLLNSIKTTLIYVIGSVFISFSVGLGIALLLNRIKIGGRILSALFLIPMVVMPAAVGMTARLFFTQYGFVNYFIETLFGFRVNWFSSTYALLAMMISNCWITIPFFAIVFYASLTSLPPTPYESAKVDGASKFLIFKNITLPLLKPIILTTIVLQTVFVFMRFDLPYMLFFGGPGSATEILSIHLARVGFSLRFLGRASVISLLFIFIILITCFFFIRFLIAARRK